MYDDHTPIDKSWRKRYAFAGTAAMYFLRVVCFAGIAASWFGLRTYFGMLVFLVFWLALERALPKFIRVPAAVASFALLFFCIYMAEVGVEIAFGIVEMESYQTESMDPVGNTSIDVRAYALHPSTIEDDYGLHRYIISGPHEIWIELEDEALAPHQLEVTKGVLITPNGEHPILFAPVVALPEVEGWTPYRDGFRVAPNTSVWKQVDPFDLRKLGPEVRLEFTLVRGDERKRVSSRLAHNNSIEGGLIIPKNWRR